MNEKLELQLLGSVYEQMFRSRAKTDNRLMELEGYITRHFGHDGTLLLREIKERLSDGPVIVTQQSPINRGYKVFEHPKARTSTAPPSEGKPNAPLLSENPKVVAGNGAVVEGNAIEVSAEKVEELINSAWVEDSFEGLPAYEVQGVLEIDQKDAKVMKAKAFGAKYGVDSMKKFLEEREIDYPNTASQTQIASIIIQYVNQ
ncbi:MAG: hypothetical protein ACRC1D_03495 [Culicoidibacterales bacterium]